MRAETFEETRNFDSKFTRVEIINPPEDFISFPNESGKIIGYLINLEELKDKQSFGKGNVATEGKVEFDKDDVFVYDKNGTVYYAKGFESVEEKLVYYNTTVYKSR